MLTLTAIIENEIRNRSDDDQLCKDLLRANMEDEPVFKDTITIMQTLSEDFIKANFKLLLENAYQKAQTYTEEEITSEDELDDVELDLDISKEDNEMLKFIQG